MIDTQVSGRLYLETWIASVFQRPYQRTPYLFVCSQVPGAGASIFHEALSLILPTRSVNWGPFNEDLQNAMIAVIDDTDLPKDQDILLRWIKDDTVIIHRKYRISLKIRNKLHWIHCINDSSILSKWTPGPTTVISLDERPEQMIPKPQLLESLQKEAPEFIGYMLTLPLPEYLPGV